MRIGEYEPKRGDKIRVFYNNQWVEGVVGDNKNGGFLFCQNEINGYDNGNLYGYKYSWAVGGTWGNENYLMEVINSVSTPPKTKIMDILVLPQEHKKLILATVEASKKENITKIFQEWGFEETIEKGRGSVILFYGPPGTGKTMCAEGVSQLLERDFLMLGSGDFQSSVPGKCEANIKSAFAKAKAENLVIILDECDSVAYSRKGVGAILGAEINCLLTEIERFDGVCILTTNRSVVLDEALERRVALKLEFKNPEENVRKDIWQKLVPKKAPLGKNVDFGELAIFNLSGGQIKNAVLTAARLAVNEGKKWIDREHFLEGVKRELLGNKMWDTARDNIPLVEEMSLRDGGLETSQATDKVKEKVKEVKRGKKGLLQTLFSRR